MTEAYATRTLCGWGRLNPAACRVYRPEGRAALGGILAADTGGGCIARGLGRSYGDPAVNEDGGVIDMARLDRMIAFDAETGVLECEGGVSLEDILDVFLPRGFFPPVTPGTKFVTVGGAIANDIHGKNHHRDGTFTQHVLDLELLTPRGEVLHCSPEENADIFWATAGGVGLTGIIVSARIRLQPVETAYMKVDYQRAPDLDSVLAAMTESDDQYQYSVAWLDALASGKHLGRAVLMRGNHATRAELPAGIAEPLAPARVRSVKTIPFDLPGFVLNPLSVKVFNTLFYAKHRDAQDRIVGYDPYFYPLDGIGHWNRMYGKRGFVQYQALLPMDGAEGLRQILERLAASRRASFLAVLKCFGEGNPGPLSYPFAGYTLALDLPMRRGLPELLRELDAMLLEHGGRLYLGKDAVTQAETIAAMYPELERFREIQARLDPEGRMASSMARRLGLIAERGEGGHDGA